MKSVLVHFEVDEHYVLLETFVASALSTKKAVEAFNQAYFGGQLDFEIVIYPPEIGSLKQYIGVLLKGGKKVGQYSAGALGVAFVVLQVLDSDTIQDVSKEFLGGKPGEIIIERIKKYQQLIERDIADDQLENISHDRTYIDDEGANLVEEIITKSVTNALEMPKASLESLDAPDQLKYDLLDAQADLYSEALLDPKIWAIGFTEDNESPVPRSNFAERAVRPRKLDTKPDLEATWEVSQRRIKVSSPNFDRENQHVRKWKGRDSTGQSLLFEILDEGFWVRLGRSEIEFTETTEMVAQVATMIEKGRTREVNVVRVLSVDGEYLADPLEGTALDAILGSFRTEGQAYSSPSLFD